MGALSPALEAGTAFAAINDSYAPGDSTVFGTNGETRIFDGRGDLAFCDRELAEGLVS